MMGILRSFTNGGPRRVLGGSLGPGYYLAAHPRRRAAGEAQAGRLVPRHPFRLPRRSGLQRSRSADHARNG